MTGEYLQLRQIAFVSPTKKIGVDLNPGVNVICGASETGKSFLAESIDFMLGGSELREIPERDHYAEVVLDLAFSNGESWRLLRAISGGAFTLVDLGVKDAEAQVLSQRHSSGQTDNISGFLLDKIGLLGKRILRSASKGTTQSLSFRNLARLVIVQEDEIQQAGSPFWGGQFTLKTAELATIKLLLTEIDDSSVSATPEVVNNTTTEITLISELISELEVTIGDIGVDQEEILSRRQHLEKSIQEHQMTLAAVQRQLETLLSDRRELLDYRLNTQGRLDEISGLLTRFDLLQEHYQVDLERLASIRESGSVFGHATPVPCPVCGAPPDAQHVEDVCDADIDGIIAAAGAEIAKIERLAVELGETVTQLKSEAANLREKLAANIAKYEDLDSTIQKTIAPELGRARADFVTLVEQRAVVERAADLYARVADLERRKASLLEADSGTGRDDKIMVGLSDPVAHSFSRKVSEILKAWNFPGDCTVHFDKGSSDFVIDGKPRGSRGKGLRAITHAAITVGLLEYCQEHDSPHPGFVVLDSPLLAYFKPEGEEDLALQGADLKERFYQYLIQHHSHDSQVIIIENEPPPADTQDRLSLTMFTGNPNKGRCGFL